MRTIKIILLVSSIAFVAFTIIPYGINESSLVSNAHSETIPTAEIICGVQGENSYLKKSREEVLEQGRILFSMLCNRCHSGKFAFNAMLPDDQIHRVVHEMETKADINLDPVQRSLIKNYLHTEIEKRRKQN